MFRSRVIAAGLLAAGALALSSGVAGAQDYPGTTAPTVCSATVTASAPMVASATVTVTGSCPTLPNGVSANGVLNSTPVQLGATTIANHAASYKVTLPADWETKAAHSLTLKDANTGALLMSARFYVDGKGAITAAPSTATTVKGIARTGASNNTSAYAKSGVALLALGAGAVGVSRRRRTTTTAAA